MNLEVCRFADLLDLIYHGQTGSSIQTPRFLAEVALFMVCPPTVIDLELTLAFWTPDPIIRNSGLSSFSLSLF